MMNNEILYFLLLLMTLMGSIASLFLKKASGKGSFIEMLKDFNIYVGGMLYLLSAILNIVLLAFMDYSVVLPLTSLTYLWTVGISYFVLKEKLSRNKVIGILLILLGAFIITL